jgi:hypothetical protein
MVGMTLMSMTFELQEPIKPDQFRALGALANTYGIHKFHYDENSKLLTLDYDASRLRETVVEHVLRHARIPVLRKLAPVS